MRGIIDWSLRFRLVVLLLAAGTVFVGVAQLRDAPVDVLPEFTPPYVEIQTEALGLSAAEVEEMITVPLEGDLLNGVAGIETIRSESVAGLSSIVLVFERGTDLLDARQLVQERLIQAHALPNVSKPPAMLQPLSSASRVLMIGLRSDELTLTEMGLLARWTIRPRLLGVPGVANVAIWGQREHQLQVQVDPKRLRAHGVSLGQVVSTTGNAQLVSPLSFLEASTPGTGGFIDTANQRLQIRHILPIATPEGLAQVPVEGAEGRRLRLGEVARVVEHHQPLIGEAVVDGGPGLLLVVEKLPGANTLEVTRGVEEALDALRPGLSGVEIDSSIFRPANFIEAAIDNLVLALIIGGALVALAAFAFQWRIAAISLVSIPLALIAAGLVLTLLGETLNVMVLAGLVLAVAVVVDDAVVGVENVWRRLRETRHRRGGTSTTAVIREALVEIRSPLACATLIILVTVLPVYFLEGRPGAFFRPLALSYALAVLASMAVALTVAPALGLILLRNAPLDRGGAPLVLWLKGAYGRALSRVVHRPLAAFVTIGVLALVTLALVPQLKPSLLPSFKEREFLVHVNAAPGTSRPEMVRITSQVSGELRSLPGVRNVGVHLGRAVMADQVVDVSSSALWVTLDPEADYGKAVASIEEVVNGYPGLEREVVTYSKEVIRAVGSVDDGVPAGDDQGVLDVLTGADEPVVVRIYGKDLDVLRGKANEVRNALSGVEGIVAPRVELPAVEPTVEIEVDLAAATQHGINPGDVRRAAATLVQGIEVGSLFEEQKVFEVIVVGVPEIRHSLTGIRDLLVDTPSGGQVRLADVADVRVAPSPTVIRREAASRHTDVAAGVRGRDVDAVLTDVERRLAQIRFPLEYHAELVGGSQERDAAQTRILAFGVAAAIAVFLLLQAAFGSWRLATVFFLALPFALVGGVVAAFAAGGGVSLGSLAGFVAVSGLTARNAVLLVDRYRRLEEDEGESFGPELVLRGAQDRLPSLVTTAGALALAFLPLIALGDVAGQELVRPLAIVLLGGLVTSTLLTLFVLPTLYVRFAASAERARVEVVFGQPARS